LEIQTLFINYLFLVKNFINEYELQGLLGALSGFLLFIVVILAYSLLTNRKPSIDLEMMGELKEFGNPLEAKINISVSLIEMKKYKEALINLKEVIEDKQTSQKQLKRARNLLIRANGS